MNKTREEVSQFSVGNVCPTVPKSFVAEPFCVSEKFWYGKKLWIKGGRDYHVFSSELFVSQSRKLQGEPLCVSDKSWYRKT